MIFKLIRKWLEKRSRVLSDRPHAMQELIDSEMGHQPIASAPRDCYRRLSEVPSNNNAPQWNS